MDDRRQYGCRSAVVVGLAALLLSCGGGDGMGGPDAGGPAELGGPDSGGPELGGPDAGGADGASPDLGGPDLPQPGNGAFDGCRGWKSCGTGRVCNLALGRCEDRSDWTVPAPVLYAFHPLEVAPGDVLVIDGAQFWGFFNPGSAKVRVGGVEVPAYPPLLDETRLLVPVTTGLAGQVEVVTNTVTLSAKLALKQSAAGGLACDPSTPTASGVVGATVDDAGPHAAGYVDLAGHVARLFYPALCGGVRRPPVKGTWPLVVLLHGNGAGYLHYAYLGQFLATWGFVAVLPDAKVDYNAGDITAITQQQVNTLLGVVNSVRNVDLGTAVPHLGGVQTTGALAWVGHSRGTARIQAVLAADAALAGATKATVFLGPVDDGQVVPGLFLVVAGTVDGQSPPIIWNMAYGRQPPPKWKIVVNGGNHSLFTDHKVWTGFLDGKPQVTRAQQIAVVTAFALPLLQRAFGQAEPFAPQLDSPPASPLYQATFAK